MPRSRRSAARSARPVGPYRPPDRVGPFTVRAQTGHGGTACTFIGSVPGPGGSEHLKCLKIPSPFLLSKLPPEEVRRIFQNEADVLKLLPPGNIARLESVVDLGDDDGVMCLVFAYIDGMTLGELIRKMRADGQLLAWEAVVGIARDIASALAEAHADCRELPTPYCHPSIVHRDVSPANAMVDVRGNTFLIDFGFARAIEATGLYASRVHPGRVAYSAPEYLSSASQGGYGPRVDLFSLGALLFEALTGRHAFKGTSVEHHIMQVLAKDRLRIEDLRPEFYTDEEPDPDLVAFVHIVDCLLEPDPDDRFQSADALLSALSSLRVGVDQRPVGARVRKYQSPLEQRVTSGRLDRREVLASVDAKRTLINAPPPARVSIPPEEVVVNAAVADELAQLAERRTDDSARYPVDFADTTPDPPVVPTTRDSAPRVAEDFPATNPSRKVARQSGVLAIVTREAASPAAAEPGSAIDAQEPIAATGPLELDRYSPAPESSAPPLEATGPIASIPEAATRPMGSSPVAAETDPFKHRQIGLPAYPTPPRPAARSRWMLVAAVGLALLLGLSLFLLGTVNTIWVPILTGQSGWKLVVDGFWTPLLTNVGAVGAMASALGTIVLACAWAWGYLRSKPPR